MDTLTGSPTMPAGLSVIPAGGEPLGESPATLILPGGGYHPRRPRGRAGGRMAGLTGHPRLRAAIPADSAPPPCTPAGRQGRACLDRSGDHGLAVDGSRVGVLGFSSRRAPCGHPGRRHPLRRCIARRAGLASRPVHPVLPRAVLPSGSPPGKHQQPARCLAIKELLARLSAELTATGDTPPAFIWHTFDDGAVDVEHSLRYALALRQAAVPANSMSFRMAGTDWALRPACPAWSGGRSCVPPGLQGSAGAWPAKAPERRRLGTGAAAFRRSRQPV